MPKLLIADGSPTMHRIIELTFAGEQMQIVSAANGEQAIALLPIARPDIVLADQALAGRNGYEIAAFIKAHPELSHVPVLLMAGAFEPVDHQRAMESGVAGEVTKPFDPGQLVARVRELLALPPACPEPVPEPAAEPVTAIAAESRPSPLKLVELQTPAARGALDDYFNRLDVALQRLDQRIATPSDQDDRALPTIDGLLGAGRDLHTDLSAGEPDTEQATRVPPPAVAPVVSDAMLDEVTRRVLERLAPDAVNQVVTQVVTTVAERLLRQEMVRLRGGDGDETGPA